MKRTDTDATYRIVGCKAGNLKINLDKDLEMTRSKTRLGILAVVMGTMVALPTTRIAPVAVAATTRHMTINCRYSPLCTEVQNSEDVFGHDVYVGHDEPSTNFYSDVPGSGTRQRYQLALPRDPSASNPLTAGKSYSFELHPAFWFGMTMCDTQSYPEQVSKCKAGSDSNIVDPTVSSKGPGSAFMEMQFYPPGWVKWGQGGNSCAATQWCAALNIDSLSENPVTGQDLNPTCSNKVGIEYVNFAFLTHNGKSQAPASPVNATAATFTPDASKDLFMNAGDHLVVTQMDTAHGLQITVTDTTNHKSGSMTASAANGFGQVQFAPSPSTACTNIPYDFHPMYSTSSEQTRVPWSAHSYNIAFSDEIGHFDFCNGTNPITTSSCPSGNLEGRGANAEAIDGDDSFCDPASKSLLVKINGCTFQNQGFDGVPYQRVWPNGNAALHPTSQLFTSPLTGAKFTTQFNRMAFEADLPRIEDPTCDRFNGANCTLLPQTDDGTPVDFYPFYSTTKVGGKCVWREGDHIPGTTNDFGQNAQYGSLVPLSYLVFGGNGSTQTKYNDFRQVLSNNPCPA